MKRFLIVLGLLFFLLGIAALVHPSLDYHKHEELAKFGPITATVDQPKSVKIPVAATAGLLVAGLILVILGARSKP